MRRRFTPPAPSSALCAADLAVTLGFGSVAAQDASPQAPGASPVPGTGTTDCAQTLGLPSGGDCVNVLHAAADAGAVDVYVDGQVALPNVAFGTASGYMAMPVGLHEVKLVPAGGDLAAAAATGQA